MIAKIAGTKRGRTRLVGDGNVHGRCREKDCRYEVAAEDEVKGFPLLAAIWVGGCMRAHRKEAHGEAH